jgi:hypothetical protein
MLDLIHAMIVLVSVRMRDLLRMWKRLKGFDSNEAFDNG